MTEVVFSDFSGINNVQKQHRLTKNDLVAAVNIDLDETRRLSRRAGSTVLSAGAAHSLFAAGELCLFRRGTGLYRLFEDNSTVLLSSAFSSSNPVSYARVSDGVYLSDGVAAMWTDGEIASPWGIVPPEENPVAAAIAGSMLAGRYLYAITFLRADDGEESGSIEAGEIELPAGGGIAFSSIPVSAQAGITHKAIYLTTPGGETLRRAIVIPNADTTATITSAALGKPLETMLMIPMPPSRVIAIDHGRLVAGLGSFLLYSPPYRPERYRPDENFIAFDSEVRQIVPVDDGRYVATKDGLYWLPGQDLARASMRKIADYGAPLGSPALVDGALVGDGVPDRVPIMATYNGFVAALPGGQASNMTIKRYWPPAAKCVSSGYVREAGKNRALFFFLT